jgi:UTP:GlnB (protein PII) uridylyltransferase
LARLVHTITDGIAVQAAGGHTRDELRQVADLALRTLLPPAPAPDVDSPVLSGAI